jgi:hypothetical protein
VGTRVRLAGLGQDMQQAGFNLQQRAAETQQDYAPADDPGTVYRVPQTMAYPSTPSAEALRWTGNDVDQRQ